ncbi:hypothetical protein [Cerasicoccus maritimus]|uniref:hypothetical protein n=1 Tax=Cerasicoccus maritimus TaxID=490089 RepID=UPI002852A7BF|nr:hypothetical protein [Cerasicoccus maritimus]
MPPLFAVLTRYACLMLVFTGTLRAQEPLKLDTDFAPKLYGYGRVPEMAWNPVSEWLYCRVIAEKMNGQQLTTNLLRFTADGEWDDTWALEHDGEITCIAVEDDGKLLIGGEFTEVDGHSTYRVARINVDGTVDTSFVATGLPDTPEFEVVEALGVDAQGRVYVGLYGEGDNGAIRLSPTGLFQQRLVSDMNVKCFGFLSDGSVLVGGDALLKFDSSGDVDMGFDARIELRYETHSFYEPPYLEINDILVVTYDGEECIWVAGRFDHVKKSEPDDFWPYETHQEIHGLALLDSSGALSTLQQESFLFIPEFGLGSNDYFSVLDICLSSTNGVAYLAGKYVPSPYGIGDLRSLESGSIRYSSVLTDSAFNTPSGSYPTCFAETDLGWVFGNTREDAETNAAWALSFDYAADEINENIHLYEPRVPSEVIPRSDGGLFLSGRQVREVSEIAVPGLVALKNDMEIDESFQLDTGTVYVEQLFSFPDGRILFCGSISGKSRQMVLLNPDGSVVEGVQFTYVGSLRAALDTMKMMWQMPTGEILVRGISALDDVELGELTLLDFTDIDTKLEKAERLGVSLLDTGVIVTSFQPTITMDVHDAAGQSDGRIVFTGSFGDLGNIVRLNRDGTVDSSFLAMNDLALVPEDAQIEVDALDRLYISSGTYDRVVIADETERTVVRLFASGELDESYQFVGVMIVWDMVALADGELVMLASSFGELFQDYNQIVFFDGQGSYVAENRVDFGYNSRKIYYSDGTVYSRYALRGIADWGRAVLPDPPGPQASIYPSIMTAREGADATFWLADRGAGETYQWLQGGAPIAGATGPSLTLDPVALADAGEISVEATGPGGEVTRTATLRVAGFDFEQWGAQRGLTTEQLAEPTRDFNGNGLTLGEEFLLRTDLGGPTTRNWARQAWDGEALELRWQMLPGRRYWVDCSPDLVEWAPLTSYTADAVENIAVSLVPTGNCFYRVRVELPSE